MPILHPLQRRAPASGAGIYDRHHAAVIRPLRLLGRSSAQFASLASSAAIGSWHRPHDLFGTVAT